MVVLLVAIIASVAGVYFYKKNKDNGGSKEPEVTVKPVSTERKDVSFELSDDYSNVENFTINIPASSKITKVSGDAAKPHSKVDIFKVLDTQLEITDDNNPNAFKLRLGALDSYETVTYPEVKNLDVTEYYENLYRVRVSKDDNTLWGYASHLDLVADCDLDEGTTPAPCSTYGLIKYGSFSQNAYCEAKTDEGLALCDEMVRSIRLVESQE